MIPDYEQQDLFGDDIPPMPKPAPKKPLPPIIEFVPTKDDICENKHGGEEMSVEANDLTDKSRDIRLIIEHMKTLGGRDATAYEVEVSFSTRRRSTVSARFSDMKNDDLLVFSGNKRKTGTGAWAKAYKLNPKKFPPPGTIDADPSLH